MGEFEQPVPRCKAFPSGADGGDRQADKVSRIAPVRSPGPQLRQHDAVKGAEEEVLAHRVPDLVQIVGERGEGVPGAGTGRPGAFRAGDPEEGRAVQPVGDPEPAEGLQGLGTSGRHAPEGVQDLFGGLSQYVRVQGGEEDGSRPEPLLDRDLRGPGVPGEADGGEGGGSLLQGGPAGKGQEVAA